MHFWNVVVVLVTKYWIWVQRWFSFMPWTLLSRGLPEESGGNRDCWITWYLLRLVDQWGAFSPIPPTLLSTLPPPPNISSHLNWVQNEIASRSVGWIFKAWLCSLTYQNVDYRTREKLLSNSINSCDPLLTSSSLFRGEVSTCSIRHTHVFILSYFPPLPAHQSFFTLPSYSF